jgi:anti-sigma-K factor RskA
MNCDRTLDAGAYLLSAMPDDEYREFAQHLDTCESCRQEIQQLQIVVDTLPMAAPQLSPDPALRSRIMSVVESEAELLRASGPEADRVPAQAAGRKRRWSPNLSLRPLTAGALASALLAVGVVGGLVLNGGSSTPSSHVYGAKVTAKGAFASLSVTGSHGSLKVVNLPSAPPGKVYQVWLQTADDPPVPTHTLFNVRKSDGSAIVPIEESVRDAQHVLVTPEPDGGSQRPTGPIVIDAAQPRSA